jgi:2-oxoisovalerate dehydrogenase E2 component (dihydrolipoyl transacylase)
VPAPFAGVVTVRHGDAGQTLAVGRPLITVEPSAPLARPAPAHAGNGTEAPGTGVAGSSVVPRPRGAAAEPSFSEPGVEVSGNVLIGYGTPAASARRRRRGGAAVLERPVVKPRPGVISPLVRKMAREHGVDLAEVTGTGPEGIIRRADVEAVLAEQAVPVPRGSRTDRRIPLRGLRKTVADKLSRSRREIPEATVWVDVDATELVAARMVLNEREPDRPVSLLSLLARFAVAGLRRFPELNSRVDGDEVVVLGAVHLGFAAQTDRGLVVPVVPDADRLNTRELAAAIATRTATARKGALTPADLTGGTFTVNNYGVFGVDGSAAIINHPEAAILGIGRVIARPWVVDDELVARKVCQLTLAFDHRVCDGGTAGGFLRFVADCVESPVTALGEL